MDAAGWFWNELRQERRGILPSHLGFRDPEQENRGDTSKGQLRVGIRICGARKILRECGRAHGQLGHISDEGNPRKGHTSAELGRAETCPSNQNASFQCSRALSCNGELHGAVHLGSVADKVQSVENTWPGKIDYSLSTPTKGVIFGTAVRVDFRLIPLLKGLKIGKITVELVETQEMVIGPPKQPKRSSKKSRVVAKETWNLPDDAEAEEIDGQEGYFLQRFITIPKSLRQCVQTVETMGIKIRHSLNFNIQLHNPDSHISEVRIVQSQSY